jgi:hypothetical protein
MSGKPTFSFLNRDDLSEILAEGRSTKRTDEMSTICRIGNRRRIDSGIHQPIELEISLEPLSLFRIGLGRDPGIQRRHQAGFVHRFQGAVALLHQLKAAFVRDDRDAAIRRLSCIFWASLGNPDSINISMRGYLRISIQGRISAHESSLVRYGPHSGD